MKDRLKYLIAAGAISLSMAACGGSNEVRSDKTPLQPAVPTIDSSLFPNAIHVDFECKSYSDKFSRDIYLGENQALIFDKLRAYVKNNQRTLDVGELDGPGLHSSVVRPLDEEPHIYSSPNLIFKNGNGYGIVEATPLLDGLDPKNRHIRLTVDCNYQPYSPGLKA